MKWLHIKFTFNRMGETALVTNWLTMASEKEGQWFVLRSCLTDILGVDARKFASPLIGQKVPLLKKDAPDGVRGRGQLVSLIQVDEAALVLSSSRMCRKLPMDHVQRLLATIRAVASGTHQDQPEDVKPEEKPKARFKGPVAHLGHPPVVAHCGSDWMVLRQICAHVGAVTVDVMERLAHITDTALALKGVVMGRTEPHGLMVRLNSVPQLLQYYPWEPSVSMDAVTELDAYVKVLLTTASGTAEEKTDIPETKEEFMDKIRSGAAKKPLDPSNLKMEDVVAAAGLKPAAAERVYEDEPAKDTAEFAEAKRKFVAEQTTKTTKEAEMPEEQTTVEPELEEVFDVTVKDEEIQTLTIDDVSIRAMSKDGVEWVAVRPICKALGIASNMQILRLKADPAFNWYGCISVGADKKMRPMFFLNLKDVHAWLLSINSSRVSEEAKPRLLKYQQELHVVLYDYFHKGFAVNPRVGDSETVVKLEGMLMAAIARLDQEGGTRRLLETEVARKEDRIGMLEHVVQESVPKVEIANEWLDSGKLFTTTDVAARIGGISAQELNRWLVAKEVLYDKLDRNSGVSATTYRLRPPYDSYDLARKIERPVLVGTGVMYTSEFKWTAEGASYIESEYCRINGRPMLPLTPPPIKGGPIPRVKS